MELLNLADQDGGKIFSGRTYLFDLEPELGIASDIVEKAILVESLFSQQVVLSESNLLDNAAIREFFRTHRDELLQAAVDDDTPLLGSLSREGGDLMATLDSFLRPSDESYEPPYFSSLSPEKNDCFRREFPMLVREIGAPRKRFLEIAGEQYRQYFELASQYFTSAGGRAVYSSSTKGYNVGLYDQVTRELDAVSNIHSSAWTSVHHKIYERLQRVLEAGRHENVQRRQQIHNAIYVPLGETVRYFQGNPYLRGKRVPEGCDPDLIAFESWRFAVNTIWNWNLIARFGVAGALHANWLKVGSNLTVPMPSGPPPEKIEFNTECQLYYDKITLDFVREVRRDERFSERIWSLYLTPGGQFVKDHVTAITSVMAKRWARSGHALPKPPPLEFFWHEGKGTTVGSGIAFLALSFLASLNYMSPGDYVSLLGVTGEAAMTSLAIETSLKRWMGLEPQSGFKRLKVDLGRITDQIARGSRTPLL